MNDPQTPQNRSEANWAGVDRDLPADSSPGHDLTSSPSRTAGRTSDAQTQKDEPSPAEEKKASWMDKLPPWLGASFKDSRKWKNYFRAMVAFFVALVLMVDTKTLQVQGQAGFFGLIVSVMIPPIMPGTTFLFAMLTLVMGMLIGWAWGCAAMAAGLSARSQTLLASSYTRAQSQLLTQPDATFQLFVFQGVFLDPRSSAVFGAFLFIGTFALGAMRAHAPKLTLLSVFGSIVMDVLCSYGPLFPSAQYTLANTFLIPTAIYIAVALASIILIFPQSLNSAVTAGLIDGVLAPANALVGLQAKVLKTSPTDGEAWSALVEQTNGLRKGFAAGVAGVDGQAGLLELELSYGRLGPGEVRQLLDKTKILVGRALGLGSFQRLVERAHEERAMMKGPEDSSSEKTTAPPGSAPPPRVRLQHMYATMHEQEQERGHGLNKLLPILDDASADLRQTCHEAMQDAMDHLRWVNEHRWSFGKGAYPKGETAADGVAKRRAHLDKLRTALDQFRKSRHQELLAPFRTLFDLKTGKLIREDGQTPTQGPSTQSLFLCFVFSTNLISYALALQDFLETFVAVEANNPKNKVQLPTKLGSLLKVATSPSGPVNPLELGADHTEVIDEDEIRDGQSSTGSSSDSIDHEKAAQRGETAEKKKLKREKHYRPDPDAEPPSNGLQRFSRKISAVWRWLTSPQGLFACKYSLVSVALWIPAVVPNAAYFTYTNRGLWALIMAQTGLGVFAGEQVSSFILRMGGTLIGLVLGMVAWYTGNAKSRGSPYGTVAATMVFMAPFLYLRMVAPPHIMPFWLMIGVTIVFVVGYSWIDTHITQLANQGVGYTLAWRRALLVIIGFAAAFIVSIFPFRPQSAKKSLRLGVAKTFEMLAELYVGEMEGVIEEARREDDEYDNQVRRTQYRTRFLALVVRLQGLEPLMGQAIFEPNMRGPWPKRRYAELIKLDAELLGCLSLFGNAWSFMRPSWDRLMLDRTAFCDPLFVADTMSTMAMLATSLRHARPLPPMIPLMERLAILRLQLNRQYEQEHGSDEDYQTIIPLTWESVQSEQLAIFATAAVAMSSAIQTIDRMYLIVRTLVGERNFEGLEAMHRDRALRDVEYARRHV